MSNRQEYSHDRLSTSKIRANAFQWTRTLSSFFSAAAISGLVPIFPSRYARQYRPQFRSMPNSASVAKRVSINPRSIGSMIAESRPASIANVRNARFNKVLAGSPKDTLLNPAVRCACGNSAFTARMVASVTLQASLLVATVITSESTNMFSSGTPAARVAWNKRRTTVIRSSQVSGTVMPPSARAKTRHPCFATSGKTSCKRSSSALIELMIGTCRAARNPAANAAGFGLSNDSGFCTESCTMLMSHAMSLASRVASVPALMSSTSAPASTCAIASLLMKSPSRSITALFTVLRVPLIFSPMISIAVCLRVQLSESPTA